MIAKIEIAKDTRLHKIFCITLSACEDGCKLFSLLWMMDDGWFMS